MNVGFCPSLETVIYSYLWDNLLKNESSGLIGELDMQKKKDDTGKYFIIKNNYLDPNLSFELKYQTIKEKIYLNLGISIKIPEAEKISETLENTIELAILFIFMGRSFTKYQTQEKNSMEKKVTWESN